MPPTKLLFLDFDGVIRLGDNNGQNPRFDPSCVDRVLRIVRETGCKIVVTSDLVCGQDKASNWSLNFMVNQISDECGRKTAYSFEQALFSPWTFLNPTIYHRDDRRARMIRDFMEAQITVQDFAILDDQEKLFRCPFGKSLEPFLVLTNNRHGIQDSHVARVVSLLGKKISEGAPQGGDSGPWYPGAYVGDTYFQGGGTVATHRWNGESWDDLGATDAVHRNEPPFDQGLFNLHPAPEKVPDSDDAKPYEGRVYFTRDLAEEPVNAWIQPGPPLEGEIAKLRGSEPNPEYTTPESSGIVRGYFKDGQFVLVSEEVVAEPAPKSAAEMTFAFGDELDKLVNRFCDEWDVPVSIVLGCLYFKATMLSIHHAKQNED